jgi:hypothetical protein
MLVQAFFSSYCTRPTGCVLSVRKGGQGHHYED